jgi:hypothetical protein
MNGVQLFTIVLQRIVAFVAVPLFVVIVFGKIFGETPPEWSTWAMIVLVLGWWVIWTRSVIHTVKVIRAVRRSERAQG